jgi:hypothetical protein
MEKQLTPFEQNEVNIKHFISSTLLMYTFQQAIREWEESSAIDAYRALDWQADPEDREVLKQVLKDRQELSFAITTSADTLERELGISA